MSLRALYDVPAPAKLNLFLHVIGRRPDGYHLLQSVFQLIDWADTLHFELRDDGRLQRHDLAEPLPADDLCLRAARALQAASGTTAGADISVLKRLPSGAGMGGGSSDAATTLLALNRLWGLDWPRARLLELALPLGADVPFFVGGRNAFVEGIGERLTPVQPPEQGFVVVKPPVSIATADIFGHPRLRRPQPGSEPAILSGSLEGPSGAPILENGFGRNDLQPPAEDRAPEVAQAARWLEARYGNSRMTGSGSAVFARADTTGPSRATLPAEALPPDWVVRECRGLQQHPLVGWAAG
jgi:4-diphosphocytidyl-2-C-methyl-D-erythritol kinase